MSSKQAVRDLLNRASWRVEKLFKKRGRRLTFLWMTETSEGRKQMFETACTAEHVGDHQLLDGLRDELRCDFAAGGVARYAVAYIAKATTVTQPTIVSRDATSRTRDVVIVEAHGGENRLCGSREIIGGQLAALEPIESEACCFAALVGARL